MSGLNICQTPLRGMDELVYFQILEIEKSLALLGDVIIYRLWGLITRSLREFLHRNSQFILSLLTILCFSSTTASMTIFKLLDYGHN